MKFLTFNILVGGALAWLVLGGGEVPGLLKSVLPASASVHAVSTDCPVKPMPEDGPGAQVQIPSVKSVPETERVERVFKDQTPELDRKVLASIKATRRNPTSPPASRAARNPRKPVHVEAISSAPREPVIQPSVGRRASVLSLAENMELYSLERVGK